MASATKVRKSRQRIKRRKTGRERKLKNIKYGTTPTKEKFFGDKTDTP